MRWYKGSIVLAAGLCVELIVAVISCLLIKENSVWLLSLALPYFAPRSALSYGIIMEVGYLSAAVSLAIYATSLEDLPKGVLLTAVEGMLEIVTLLFFFQFTYEITSFFLATATIIFSVFTTSVFLSKRDAAGIARLPSLILHLYLWAILYCILMINFT